jgi:hypothetical protein
LRAVIKSFETRAHRILLRGDGLVRVYSKPEDVDISAIEELFNTIIEISGGEKVLLFINPTEATGMTEEARKLLVQNFERYTAAMAAYIITEHSKNISSLISNVDKPKTPVKFFSDKDEAIAWLETFK